MIIDQLPAIEVPVLSTDELAIERGTLTYKATVDELQSDLKSQVIKDQIAVKVVINANGSATKSIAGLTADHVCDSLQFYTDDLVTPSADNLADISWTPGAGTLTVTVANKSQNCYALLGFSYKPNIETMTIS